MAYYGKQLRRVPADLFPHREPSDGPRYRRGELRSRRLPPALRILARRYRTSTSTVVFAAMLRGRYGDTLLPITLVIANRVDPRLRNSVKTLTQTVLEVGRRPSRLVHRLGGRCPDGRVRAFRYGGFDPLAFAALQVEVDSERGTDIDLMRRFNDARPPSRPVRAEEDRAAVREVPPSIFNWKVIQNLVRWF